MLTSDISPLRPESITDNKKPNHKSETDMSSVKVQANTHLALEKIQVIIR